MTTTNNNGQNVKCEAQNGSIYAEQVIKFHLSQDEIDEIKKSAKTLYRKQEKVSPKGTFVSYKLTREDLTDQGFNIATIEEFVNYISWSGYPRIPIILDDSLVQCFSYEEENDNTIFCGWETIIKFKDPVFVRYGNATYPAPSLTQAI